MKSEIIAFAIVAFIMLAFVQATVGIAPVLELLSAVVRNQAPEFMRVLEMVK